MQTVTKLIGRRKNSREKFMSAKAKKITIIALIAVIALAALSLGARGVSMYFLPFGDSSGGGYTISF